MGCDLSKQTYKYFLDRTNEVSESIKSIKKDQESLQQSLKHLSLPNEPEETIEELKLSLTPHLERIEKMLEEIKTAKEQNNNNKAKNKNNDQKKKFQVSTKADSQEPVSRESPAGNKNTKEVMSILEDPKIKAMIEKNKQKFMGKKK